MSHSQHPRGDRSARSDLLGPLYQPPVSAEGPKSMTAAVRAAALSEGGEGICIYIPCSCRICSDYREKHRLSLPPLCKASPLVGPFSWVPAAPTLSKPQALAGKPHHTRNTGWAVSVPPCAGHACACAHPLRAHTLQGAAANGCVPQGARLLSPQPGRTWSRGGIGQWGTAPSHTPLGAKTQCLEDPERGEAHAPPEALRERCGGAVLFQMCFSKNIPFLCILTPRLRIRTCFRREGET